jgi:hypothetical protein
MVEVTISLIIAKDKSTIDTCLHREKHASLFGILSKKNSSLIQQATFGEYGYLSYF